MSEVLDRYRTLADDFSARVNTVPAADWSNQSPCEGWQARDVVAHVIEGHRRFLATLDGTPEPSGDPGEDVVPAWAAARSDFETALADPDRAGRVVETPFGAMPFEALIGRFVCVDLLVHTWDLSRATGLDERINADAVGHAYEGLKPMDAMLRGPGRFADKVTPPAGADLQTEFLCFLGRDAAPLP
ncbi:MAG: TIGR03086 family metal-binding protein [Pseudonocardiaceae bacterium]